MRSVQLRHIESVGPSVCGQKHVQRSGYDSAPERFPLDSTLEDSTVEYPTRLSTRRDSQLGNSLDASPGKCPLDVLTLPCGLSALDSVDSILLHSTA